MFYCETCGKKLGWPTDVAYHQKTYTECAGCRKGMMCIHTPDVELPSDGVWEALKGLWAQTETAQKIYTDHMNSGIAAPNHVPSSNLLAADLASLTTQANGLVRQAVDLAEAIGTVSRSIELTAEAENQEKPR